MPKEWTLVIIGVFAAFAFLTIRFLIEASNQKKRMERKLLLSFREDTESSLRDADLDAIRAWSDEREADGSASFSIDDYTWEDLNMDEVFRRMDRSMSSAGQDTLYDYLRHPSMSLEELKKREKAMNFFLEKEKERVEIQKALGHVGGVKVRSLRISFADYLKLYTGLNAGSSLLDYLGNLGLLVSLIGLFFVPPVFSMLLVFFLVANSVRYFTEKSKLERYVACIEAMTRLVRHGKTLASLMKAPELEAYKAPIARLTKELSVMERKAVWIGGGSVGSNDMAGVFLEYLNMLLHLNLIAFRSLQTFVREKTEDIKGLYYAVGEVDALISLASYRFRMGEVARPEFTEEKQISFENLRHPLVENCVPNSLPESNAVLLTGANASGKSTFLRTVAINSLFAQTGYFVLGSAYRAPFVRLYSSMSLKDSVLQGESYYMTEIRAVKRILDHAGDHPEPILCFVDEVLRGTNTVERIAASSCILKAFSEKGILSFAATHDIELTEILSDIYSNYHFEEELTEEDISFSYRLKEGPATTRNAIRLLERMGYEKRLTDEAGILAEHFLREGSWTKGGK